MSRDKLWYFIHDQDGKVAELDRELDLLDLDIALTQRHQFRETKRRLDDHGLDTTNYKPIPLPRPQEERSYNHFRDDDDIEALVIAATETPLDRAYRELVLAREGIRLQPGETLLDGDGRRTFR